MADTVTPVLGFTKPEVGASRDSWGAKTNANWDKADTLATKASVDALAGRVTTVENENDAQDAAIASKADAAAQDTRDDAQDAAIAGKAPAVHTHPQSDITNLVSDLALKAPLASPTFTGDPKAPTPATPDNDTSIATTAFVKAQAYLTDAPNDGTQYVRKNAAWSPVSVPPGTAISDAPPASPQPGQMWFESDTGILYIWFDDGSSQQWVQIPASASPSLPPTRQTFTIGSTGVSIPVPTGAKMARLQGRVFIAGNNLQPGLRLSLNGSTFYAGASDYTFMGHNFYNGSAANAKQGVTPYNCLALAQYQDLASAWAPLAFEATVGLLKASGVGQYFGYMARGWSYHSAATAGAQDALYAGYTGHTDFNAATQIVAMQIVSATAHVGTFAANSMVTVDWSY